MASVRISHNMRNPNKMDWAGAPELDDEGHIERTLNLPEALYESIEQAIAKGHVEGTVYLDQDTRVHWQADR
jgi:hypothetical protein